MKKLKISLLAVIAALSMSYSSVYAQKEIKLISLSDELVVDVSPEEAWMVINSFGDVGSYHSSITSSKPLNESANEGYMGCERQCTIENGKQTIIVDEEIIEYVDGEYYKYEVTDAVNFKAKAFYNTFGVKTNASGQTVIYVLSEYRLKPGFMSGLAKGKLKKGNHDALVFYKHYMETGEKNADPEMLREKYKEV